MTGRRHMMLLARPLIYLFIYLFIYLLFIYSLVFIYLFVYCKHRHEASCWHAHYAFGRTVITCCYVVTASLGASIMLACTLYFDRIVVNRLLVGTAGTGMRTMLKEPKTKQQAPQITQAGHFSMLEDTLPAALLTQPGLQLSQLVIRPAQLARP